MTQKLKERIKEKYGSEAAFARALGNHRGTVSFHLNKGYQFSGKTIKKWSELLDIAPEEIGDYFFEKEKP